MVMAMAALTTLRVQAQTVDEWLRQRETQIKYLVEQIAALKACGAVVNKGYTIAGEGLAVISCSKAGDYGQHDLYFKALWKVKPGILNDSRARSIYQVKAAIEREQRLFRSLVSTRLPREKASLNAVSFQLMEACNDIITELSMVGTDDRLQLKDHERIEQIDKLFVTMQDHQRFSHSFVREVKQLVRNREREGGELNRLLSLYQLK